MKITRRQLRRIIRESIAPSVNVYDARRQLMKQFTQLGDGQTSYPYGRYRGDVRSTNTYVRKDGRPISDEDMAILTAVEEHNHPLGGSYTHTRSQDFMSVRVKYYKHTSG